MLRPLTVCALIGSFALPAPAQEEKKQPTEMLVKFHVDAKPAPRPALRYELLPELREMQPGNPIHGYLMAFMEQNAFWFGKSSAEEREKWQNAPLAELPDLKGYGGVALRQADFAARLTDPDWQVLLKLKKEGIDLLLPEVQQFRVLANGLKVRLRGEIKDRRFDDAIRTIKTMLALARHMGEHPTLIGSLVGFAITAITIDGIEQLSQQPGAPNLYWAYAALPAPFIDLRTALQGERIFMHAEFPMLDGTDPISDFQIEKALARMRQIQSEIKVIYVPGKDGAPVKAKEETPDPVAFVRKRAGDEKELSEAKKELAGAGYTEEQLKRMLPLQVILLHERFLFEVYRDEMAKWLMLPYWQAAAGHAASEQTFKAQHDATAKGRLFLDLVPASSKVHMAQARTEQRFAMLRVLEALRLHAAENGGKLPAKLDEVKLPLPVDPMTGKPFLYELDGQTAHLRGSPPRGMEKVPVYNVHYEVTIKK